MLCFLTSFLLAEPPPSICLLPNESNSYHRKVSPESNIDYLEGDKTIHQTSLSCEGNLCNCSNLPIEWIKGMIEIPVGQITEETLGWKFSTLKTRLPEFWFQCLWFVSEPDRGGGAQNSTDWSPPSPPTINKPVTSKFLGLSHSVTSLVLNDHLFQIWLLGELRRCIRGGQ